jgi:hypothetical protein
MATITVDNAVIVAVAGLVAKEATTMIIKLLGRKNGGNGKNTLRGLLEDIRGQGRVTLDKVGTIEKEQVEIKIALKGMTADMVNFKEKCVEQDERLDTLDQRFFDHIKRAGG